MPSPFRFFMVSMLISVPALIFSQDVEQVIKSPALVTSGGFNMSHIFNYSPDSLARYEPYSYYLSGNVNSTLFGVVNLPFSFAYTNNQVTGNLPQPFNRFSLSPSYRWITTHMGYGSMSFSPYTLAGHEFYGGGVELKPDNGFRFAAMHGRLRKAVPQDSLAIEPMFRRMGSGISAGYEGSNVDVMFSLFKAKDEVNSISQFEPTEGEWLKPADNLAGSIRMNIRMANGFLWMGEFGASAINHDISSTEASKSGNSLFNSRGDVTVHHAFKTSVAQTTSLGRIGASYERVEPNYRTFGGYYFVNDFENITANLGTVLFKTVNFGMDIGFQRDNIENQKTTTAKRAIYSGNVAAPVNNRLSLALAMSNVQSFVHIKDIYDEVTRTNQYQNLDTLNFTRLDMASSINANYVLLANEKLRQNINAGFSYQEASQQQDDDKRYIGSRIYNSMLSYMFSLTPSRFTVSATVNHNQNAVPEITMHVLSTNVTVQKIFPQHIRAAFAGTLSNSFSQQGKIANIVNLRVTGGYSLIKRHNFNLSLAMINNQAQRGHTTHYSANFSYSYIFNMQIFRKDGDFKFDKNF